MALKHHLWGKDRRCRFRLPMRKRISFNFCPVFSQVLSRTNAHLSPSLLPLLTAIVYSLLSYTYTYKHLQITGRLSSFYCTRVYTYSIRTMTFLSFSSFHSLPVSVRHAQSLALVFCVRPAAVNEKLPVHNTYNISSLIFTAALNEA